MYNLKSLSLYEKAAQTAVALTNRDIPYVDEPVGGIFIGAQVITEVEDGVETLRQTVKYHRNKIKTPPLVISDFENGCGSMIKGLTPFPFGMSLGAANDEQLAYNYGKATAIEALSAGANATFSPVCDLNLNPRNPLVNVRSISDNPDHAIKLLRQVILGMQENGLGACAKHFPGDGIDWRDQHIITSSNTLPFDVWKKYSGKVFEELIKINVSMIMPGHISFPAYQKERVNGLALPATLSSEILTGLIKEEMGYKGVLVSDSTFMGGFDGYYKDKPTSEIECFKAGCDIVLWPSKNYIQNLVDAVENGYVKESRLNDALERIEAMKEKYIPKVEADEFTELSEEQRKFAISVQKDVAEKSMTLVKDKNNLLPLNKNVKKILLVTVCNHPPVFEDAKGLKTEFENRGYEVIYYDKRPNKELYAKQAKEADAIIYALYTRSFRPIGPIDFWEENAWIIAESRSVCPEKVMFVSFGNPYFATQYAENVGTYVNAYSFLPSSITAFARATCGEIPFTDFSPVKLDTDILKIDELIK